MDFIGIYTPLILLRVLTTTELTALYLSESIVVLLLFAAITFLLVDAVSGLLFGFMLQPLHRNIVEGMLSTPNQTSLVRRALIVIVHVVPDWFGRLVIGLPMFHVVYLTQSQDLDSIQRLRGYAFGTNLDEHVLNNLPKSSWLPFKSSSSEDQFLAYVLVAVLVLFTYWLHTSLYGAYRRIRLGGDILINEIPELGHPKVTHITASMLMQRAGWTPAESEAGAWFISMKGLRIIRDNRAMVSPGAYGFYRVTLMGGAISLLTAVTPVLGALLLMTEFKQIAAVRKMQKMSNNHIIRLPARIRQQIYES